MKWYLLFLLISIFRLEVRSQCPDEEDKCTKLRIVLDQRNSTISVFRDSSNFPILTQVAKMDERPYIHPIVAPDGNGVFTEYRPSHHLHQTGIYWGLKRVNERDFFMNWKSDYWQGVSANILQESGTFVKWQTVYNLLDAEGNTIITETQNWTMHASQDKYYLDLDWKGEAKMDVTMGKFYVGGLFVRMPWEKQTVGKIINSSGLQNAEMESKRAIWSDVGVMIKGRNDFAHIAIFDHPKNSAFPTPWRVDSEMGLGPSRQISGDWSLREGESERVRYRLVIYSGDLPSTTLTRMWTRYSTLD